MSAATIAAHYLRNSNQESTIFRCFALAFKHLGRLWIFTIIDAFITINAILRRLPQKREEGERGTNSALAELAYYAWKIGTVGVMPALIAGKGFIDAAKDSVLLLKAHPLRTIGIRMGYSFIFWIIGITAYIGALDYFFQYGDHENQVHEIYNFYRLMNNFYRLMIVPICLAVGVTSVFIRPFFIVMSSKLYTDTIPLKKEAIEINTAQKFGAVFISITTFFFIMFMSIMLIPYLYGDKLGIRKWIESVAQQEITEYRQMPNKNTQGH